MNRFCVEKWNNNRELLRRALMEYPELETIHYTDLMNLCVKHIINPGLEDYMQYEEEAVSVWAGSYQGEILFVLTPKSMAGDFLVSMTSYGSCSYCDTLARIHSDWFSEEIDREEAVREYMYVCKDMVCNIVKPYNEDYHHDPQFDTIEEVIWEDE